MPRHPPRHLSNHLRRALDARTPARMWLALATAYGLTGHCVSVTYEGPVVTVEGCATLRLLRHGGHWQEHTQTGRLVPVTTKRLKQAAGANS